MCRAKVVQRWSPREYLTRMCRRGRTVFARAGGRKRVGACPCVQEGMGYVESLALRGRQDRGINEAKIK